MVRTVTVKGKEYYVVTTSLQVDGIEVPVQIHVNISPLSEENKFKIQKHSNYFFNRAFKVKTPSPKQVKKPWYKFW